MKWVCTKCGSSHVFVDAHVAINDRSQLIAFGEEFCEHCNAGCEIKQVPQRTAEPEQKGADHGRTQRSRARHRP